MDGNYPIDVHYNKLLDWLIDRRHCDSKWHIQSKVIRSQVNKAILALPSNNPELAKILQSGDLTYFDCKEVLEILKTLDGVSTSLFGQYTAPRVKEWVEILKAYEQKKIFLAECGQQLARLVNYDIPALKQQLSRCQKVIRDNVHREGELKVHAAALRDSYQTACADMGIKGVHVLLELSQLVASLPDVFHQLLEDLPALLPAINYYHAFLQATKGRIPDDDQFLVMLNFILKYGNVTVYQWKHGEPCPNLVPEQTVTEDVDDSCIDFGLGGASKVVSRDDDGIDFGEVEELEDVTLEITVEDSGVTEEGGVVAVEVNGVDGKTTSNSVVLEGEAESLLENRLTRNLFLDDLHELKEFISCRNHELTSDNICLLQMGCLDELRAQELGVADMLHHVTNILHHLTNQKVQHLFLIKGSRRYLQRLADKVTENLKLSNKATSQALEAVAKSEQASASLGHLQPQYMLLVARAKQLQTQMSQEISALYNKRKVNIMGEINQIT